MTTHETSCNAIKLMDALFSLGRCPLLEYAFELKIAIFSKLFIANTGYNLTFSYIENALDYFAL